MCSVNETCASSYTSKYRKACWSGSIETDLRMGVMNRLTMAASDLLGQTARGKVQRGRTSRRQIRKGG